MPRHKHQPQHGMFRFQLPHQIGQYLFLAWMGAPPQQNDLALIPAGQLTDFSPLTRIVGSQVGHIVFHAPHEMQTVFRKPRDGETSQVLLALDPNPAKELNHGADKSPRRPEQAPIPARKPRIHQADRNPHLFGPPKHVRPNLVLDQNQGAGIHAPEGAHHRIIKIRRHINQTGFVIQERFRQTPSGGCSHGQKNPQMGPMAAQFSHQNPG